MLGLDKGSVELVSHNEQWHQMFADERSLIMKAVGKSVKAVKHIGSTSICGISAKPILDLTAVVETKADGENCIAPLETIGYKYRGENGIAGRFYFVKGTPRTHHLHILLADSAEFKNHLAFRDFLRKNPASAAEYDSLKQNLALKYKNDRDAYLAGKATFIEKILQMAQKS